MPSYPTAVLIARWFGVAPIELLKLAGDEDYIEQFERESRKIPTEEDLYPVKEHAELHRKLQTVLEHGTKEEVGWLSGNLVVFHDRIKDRRKTPLPKASSG